MQWLSLRAPQQPKNATINITAPIIISGVVGTVTFDVIMSSYSPRSMRYIIPGISKASPHS